MNSQALTVSQISELRYRADRIVPADIYWYDEAIQDARCMASYATDYGLQELAKLAAAQAVSLDLGNKEEVESQGAAIQAIVLELLRNLSL